MRLVRAPAGLPGPDSRRGGGDEAWGRAAPRSLPRAEVPLRAASAERAMPASTLSGPAVLQRGHPAERG